MCEKNDAMRWIGPMTASPSGTASAPPGQKSFWTSMTRRTSVVVAIKRRLLGATGIDYGSENYGVGADLENL
jgi:hypothetical protein